MLTVTKLPSWRPDFIVFSKKTFASWEWARERAQSLR